MPIADFFQGLLGGLAGGIADQGMQKHREELAQRYQKSQTATDLLKSGNYEAFSIIMDADPALAKSLGFEKQDPRVQALVGYQRKAREVEQKTQESTLATKGLQQQTAQLELSDAQTRLDPNSPERRLVAAKAKTAELGTAEEETKQKVLAGLRGDDRVAAMFPGVVNAKIAQENSRIHLEDIKARGAERLAVLQQAQQQFTVQMEQVKESRASREQIAAETASLKQQQITTQKEIKEEGNKTRKLSIAVEERQKADEQRNKIALMAPKQSKIGKDSYPSFTTKGEADVWITKANQAERRYAQAQKRIADLEEGFTPDEPITWNYAGEKGWPVFGKDTHVAVSQQAGQEQAPAPTAQSPLDRMLEKAQGTKPTAQATTPTTQPIVRQPSATDTLNVPSDTYGQQQWASATRQAKAAKSQSAKIGILTQAGIPADWAKQLVENNQLDLLENTIANAPKQTGRKK